MITLTREEMIRFGLYCKQESLQYKQLLEQLEKLPGQNLGKILMGAKADAFVIVSRHLLEVEVGEIKQP